MLNCWPIADDIMVILNIYIDIHILEGTVKVFFFDKLSTGTKVAGKKDFWAGVMFEKTWEGVLVSIGHKLKRWS